MLLKVARFKVLLKYLLLFLSFANSNSNDSSVLYGEENGTDFVDAVGRLEFDMFLLRQWAVRLWHLRDGSTLTLLSESYFFGEGGWEKGWWSAESKCLPLLSIKSKLSTISGLNLLVLFCAPKEEKKKIFNFIWTVTIQIQWFWWTSK